MPVHLSPPDPAALSPVQGIRIGVAMAAIRKSNRRDLVLFALDEGSAVAGVFTSNRFCAAPVQLCQRHLAIGHDARALLVNTGNANAGTGADGLARARSIVTAHGGTVTLQSAPGAGTRASIVLPVWRGEQSMGQAA